MLVRIQSVFKRRDTISGRNMQRLKGNRITDIRLAIGDKLKEQENDIFITKNLKEKPIYTQMLTGLKLVGMRLHLILPLR